MAGRLLAKLELRGYNGTKSVIGSEIGRLYLAVSMVERLLAPFLYLNSNRRFLLSQETQLLAVLLGGADQPLLDLRFRADPLAKLTDHLGVQPDALPPKLVERLLADDRPRDTHEGSKNAGCVRVAGLHRNPLPGDRRPDGALPQRRSGGTARGQSLCAKRCRERKRRHLAH